MSRSVKLLITAVIVIAFTTFLLITSLYAKNDYDIVSREIVGEEVLNDLNVETSSYTETSGSIKTSYYLLISTEALVIGFTLSFALVTRFHKYTIKSVENKMLTAVLLVLLSFSFRELIIVPIYFSIKGEIDASVNAINLKNKYSYSEGVNITTTEINLYSIHTNINITEGGTYNVTGSFSNAIIINSELPVTLNFDNVNITNSDNSAIINKNKGKLIINLEAGSNNVLTSGSIRASSNRGTIYTESDLIIAGTGALNINSIQENSSGIYLKDASLEVNNALLTFNTKDKGIYQEGSEDEYDVAILSGSTYIMSENDPILTNGDVIIKGGTTYLASTKGSSSPVNYQIRSGNFIGINIPMMAFDQKSSQPTVSVSFEKQIDKDTIISLKDSMANNQILSFRTRADVKSITLSSPSIQVPSSLVLFKGGENTGALVNNVYLGGQYTPGEVIYIKGRGNIAILDTHNDYS